jgi:regulatory protein
MVITQITAQQKDPSRVNLFVDGIFYSGISVDILAKENLYEGKEVTSEVLDRALKEDLVSRFLSRSVDNISRTPKSEFQIRKYLKELKFKKKGTWYEEGVDIDWEGIFDQVVDRLKEYKYLDDENFARMFVSGRIRNRPRGKSIMIGELISKGIDKEIAQRVCDELIVDEYELLVKTFRKRFKGERFSKENTKMIGFLFRKGYSWDLIEKFAQDESEK